MDDRLPKTQTEASGERIIPPPGTAVGAAEFGSAQTVVLCIPNRLIGEGLKSYLERRCGLHVIAMAESGDEAWIAINRYQPGWLISDFEIGQPDGLKLCCQTRDLLHEKCHVVLYTDPYSATRYLRRAQRFGVRAVVLNNRSYAVWPYVVSQIQSHMFVLDPILQDDVQRVPKELGSLFEIELDVLRRMAMNADEIADELNVSRITVAGAIERVKMKVDARTNSEAIIKSAQLGLIHFPKMPRRNEAGSTNFQEEAQTFAQEALDASEAQ